MASATARPRPAPSSERLEFEASEAALGFLAPIRWNPGTAIADLDPDLAHAGFDDDSDLATR